MKNLRFLLAISVFFVFTGCVPKERFAWSPEGERAAVVIQGTLHLVDESGTLLGEPLPGSENAQVVTKGMEWLPAGDGLVAHRVRIFSEWKGARQALPEESARRIEALSREMPTLLSAAVALGGDAENVGALLGRLEDGSSAVIAHAFRHAFERRPKAVRQALAGAPECRSSLGSDHSGNGESGGYPVHELALVRLGESRSGEDATTRILVRGVEAIVAPRVSPEHPVVAYGIRRSADQLVSLSLVSLEGERCDPGVDGVHAAFDWTPGGRSLAFLAPLSNEKGLLKRVMKVELLDEAGNWKGGEPDDRTAHLATAVIPFSPCLAVSAGGDVLFASQTGRLPTAKTDASYRAHLYRVSIGGGEVRRVPTPEGALPMDLGHFVPSPDGSRVAVVESESDAVAVVELESGRTEIVSPSHPRWKCSTLPAWRGANELSFAALDEASETVRWKLRREDGSVTVLSDGWPEDATKGWLKREEPNGSDSAPGGAANGGAKDRTTELSSD